MIQTQKYVFFHKWINKLFPGENKVSEHCLKLERLEKNVFVVSVWLFSLFSHENNNLII